MAEQSRLDVLEGRVEELSRHWAHLFGEIGRLDHKIETLGSALSARIDALDQKFDRRVEALEQKFDRRFEAVDRRFDAVDQKFDRRFDAVDRKMDDIRAELSRQFRWTFSTMLALLGMMLTVGAGVATALLRARLPNP
jgi:predicted RNase H-like nuclease (RuvC/YqgF family)